MAGDLVLICGLGDEPRPLLDSSWLQGIAKSLGLPEGMSAPAIRRTDWRYEDIDWTPKARATEVDILDFVCRWIARRQPEERYFVLVIMATDERSFKLTRKILVPWTSVQWIQPPRFSHVPAQANKVRAKLGIDLRIMIKSHSKRAKILLDHLFEAKRQTPLLLPDEKAAGLVKPELDQLADFIRGDIQGALAASIKRFEANKGVSKSAKSAKIRQRFYEIDGLVFQCPAVGHAWDREPSCVGGKDCFLRSRMRIGVSIDPQFHYDCRAGKGSHLPTNFASCHGQRVAPARAREKGYVNVAPNDFVR